MDSDEEHPIPVGFLQFKIRYTKFQCIQKNTSGLSILPLCGKHLLKGGIGVAVVASHQSAILRLLSVCNVGNGVCKVHRHVSCSCLVDTGEFCDCDMDLLTYPYSFMYRSYTDILIFSISHEPASLVNFPCHSFWLTRTISVHLSNFFIVSSMLFNSV